MAAPAEEGKHWLDPPEWWKKSKPLRWVPISGATQTRYRDAVASTPTDWMAVGDGGATARYVGGAWTSFPALVGETMMAVTAVGPGRYIAVTYSGAVYRFRSGVWTELYRRGSGNFAAVWAKDESNIVAVGDAGAISRSTNGAWADQDALTGGSFVAVSGTTDGSVVSALVGTQGFTMVFTSVGGGAFAPDPGFPPIASQRCSDLVYDAGVVWYASCFDPGPTAAFIHRSGEPLWSFAVGREIRGLQWIGPDSLATTYTDFTFSRIGLLVGGVSQDVSDPLGADLATISAVAPAAEGFIGVGLNNHLYRYTGPGTGGLWSDVQSANDWPAPDFWGIGDTVWALQGDGSGSFSRIDGGVVTPINNEPGLRKLWGVSSALFYAIGPTGIYTSNGTSPWVQDGDPLALGVDYRDIWADPSNGSVIALDRVNVSGTHVVLKYLGAWQRIGVADDLTAVWGCDPTHFWITSANGYVYTPQGPFVLPDPAFPGTIGALTAVTGTSCSDVWVTGDDGALFHWNGSAWVDKSTGDLGVTFTALTPRATGQIIVLGPGGFGYLASDPDPSPPQQWNLPSQGHGILSAWRLDDGEVISAGADFLLRGTQ